MDCFARRRVTIEQVLSDNGGTYRSHLWRNACEALSITPKRTRPYRPQTNGRVERFHRTTAAMGGSTPTATPTSESAVTHSRCGFTTTTTTARTQPAATSRSFHN